MGHVLVSIHVHGLHCCRDEYIWSGGDGLQNQKGSLQMVPCAVHYGALHFYGLVPRLISTLGARPIFVYTSHVDRGRSMVGKSVDVVEREGEKAVCGCQTIAIDSLIMYDISVLLCKSKWLTPKTLVHCCNFALLRESSTRDSRETELSPDFAKAPSTKEASAPSDLPL